MIKSRRKVKVNIQTEYPPKKRVQRSKLINSMMGWMNKKESTRESQSGVAETTI